MDLNMVTDEAAIHALAPEWRELYGAHGWSPFQSFDIFWSWWTTLGKASGESLLVGTARVNGRLAAVAPLSIRRRLGVRVLRWAGCEVFDYCDILHDPAIHPGQLWAAIRRTPAYDIGLLEAVHPGARCRAELERTQRPMIVSRAPHLTLDWPDGKAWLAAAPSMRKHHRRCLKHLEHKGGAKFHALRPGKPHHSVIDVLIRQKTQWARDKGIKSIFDHAGTGAFLHSLVDLPGDEPHLSWLECGGQVLACHLGFVKNKTFYWYMPSYDPAWSECSPGTLLMVFLITTSLDSGMTDFDYMRGAEGYKMRTATASRELGTYVFPRGWRGALLYKTVLGAYLRRRLSGDEGAP